MFAIFLSVTPLVLAENYTTELQSAYNYAHDISITTQPTIDAANMYGSLIRAHMAKMMVNYAEGVLGLSPNEWLTCNFTDIDDQSTELKGYIKEACQLGLMGQGITEFKPNDPVTRAQFGTVLSRAIYGDAYNNGDPYYINHLNALRTAGIMTKIDTPDMKEIRWYVMLMMMRASEAPSTQPSQCDTSEIQLLWLVGSPDCPSECQSNGTIAGNLNVSKISTEVGMLPSGTKYVGSLKFTATNSDITIQTFTFQKIGTFTKGWIEDDGVQIALMQSALTDTSTTVTFSPSLKIKSDESKTLSIFIESTSASEQWVSLTNKQNIQSSASVIEWSFPMRVAE